MGGRHRQTCRCEHRSNPGACTGRIRERVGGKLVGGGVLVDGLGSAGSGFGVVEPVALAAVSMMWQRWVSRSRVAPVSRSEPRTSVHDSNGRLVVMIIAVRSYAVEITSKSSSAPILVAGT